MEPLDQRVVTQIEDFLSEIRKFIDLQPTLTPDEVSSMKHELTVASEKLKTASDTIKEKVKRLEKFLEL